MTGYPNSLQGRAFRFAIAASIVLASLWIVIQTILYSDRGFEFTDESFYLMSMQRPASYSFVYGLWPYFWAPLYHALKGDIGSIQRAGAVLMALMGGAVGAVAWGVFTRNFRSAVAPAFIATAMAAPFVYYVLWLVMPGYNLCALIGGLSLLAAVSSMATPSTIWMPAWFAGVALIAGLAARPHNAVAFGIIYLVSICLLRNSWQDRIRLMMTSGVAFFLIVAAALLALPIRVIGSQFQSYFDFFHGSHPVQYSFWAQQLQYLSGNRSLACAAFLFGAVLISSNSSKPLARWTSLLSRIVLSILLFWGVGRSLVAPSTFVAGQSGGVIALCVIGLLYPISYARQRTLMALAVAALIPWASTAGSSNPTVFQVAMFAGISNLVALIALVACRPNAGWLTIIGCVAVLGMTGQAVRFGMANPYRLAAPLQQQLIPTDVGWGSVMKVDPATNSFLKRARKSVSDNGFCEGDPAIDFTGRLPGLVYAMGGVMPLVPWIFSGYPFSKSFLAQYVARIDPETLKNAWLVVNDNPTYGFRKSDLEQAGVSLSNYQLVDILTNPVDAMDLQIYKPVPKSIAAPSCSSSGLQKLQ
jgi:hypothetical protein